AGTNGPGVRHDDRSRRARDHVGPAQLDHRQGAVGARPHVVPSNVRDSYDLSGLLFSADGTSLAQGTYSVPSFTGTAPATLRHMLGRFPAATLRPRPIDRIGYRATITPFTAVGPVATRLIGPAGMAGGTGRALAVQSCPPMIEIHRLGPQ